MNPFGKYGALPSRLAQDWELGIAIGRLTAFQHHCKLVKGQKKTNMKSQRWNAIVLLFSGTVVGTLGGSVILLTLSDNLPKYLDWESLITGALAFVGAAMALLAAYQQIKANRALEEERRKRSANAHRMQLINLLDDLMRFCRELYDTSKSLTNLINEGQSTKELNIPFMPKDTLLEITACMKDETLEVQECFLKSQLRLRQFYEKIQSIAAEADKKTDAMTSLFATLPEPDKCRLVKSSTGDLPSKIEHTNFLLIESYAYIFECFEIINTQIELERTSDDISKNSFIRAAEEFGHSKESATHELQKRSEQIKQRKS